MVALIVLTIIFIEVEFSFIGAIIGLINFFTVICLLAIGILAAIATYNIDQSEVDGTKSARSKALTATLISLVTLGVLLIYYVISFFVGKYQERKENEALAELIAMDS